MIRIVWTLKVGFFKGFVVIGLGMGSGRVWYGLGLMVSCEIHWSEVGSSNRQAMQLEMDRSKVWIEGKVKMGKETVRLVKVEGVFTL